MDFDLFKEMLRIVTTPPPRHDANKHHSLDEIMRSAFGSPTLIESGTKVYDLSGERAPSALDTVGGEAGIFDAVSVASGNGACQVINFPKGAA